MATPTPTKPVLALFSLAHNNALITGASRGIGAACAHALAQAGVAHLVLVLRPPAGVSGVDAPAVDFSVGANDFADDSTVPAIIGALRAQSPGTRLSVVYADLGDVASVKSVFPRALAAVGGGKGEGKGEGEGGDEGIDVLVHCAGIQRRAPAVVFGETEWDEVRCVLVLAFLVFGFGFWFSLSFSVSIALRYSAFLSLSFACFAVASPYIPIPGRATRYAPSHAHRTSHAPPLTLIFLPRNPRPPKSPRPPRSIPVPPPIRPSHPTASQMPTGGPRDGDARQRA